MNGCSLFEQTCVPQRQSFGLSLFPSPTIAKRIFPWFAFDYSMKSIDDRGADSYEALLNKFNLICRYGFLCDDGLSFLNRLRDRKPALFEGRDYTHANIRNLAQGDIEDFQLSEIRKLREFVIEEPSGVAQLLSCLFGCHHLWDVVITAREIKYQAQVLDFVRDNFKLLKSNDILETQWLLQRMTEFANLEMLGFFKKYVLENVNFCVEDFDYETNFGALQNLINGAIKEFSLAAFENSLGQPINGKTFDAAVNFFKEYFCMGNVLKLFNFQNIYMESFLRAFWNEPIIGEFLSAGKVRVCKDGDMTVAGYHGERSEEFLRLSHQARKQCCIELPVIYENVRREDCVDGGDLACLSRYCDTQLKKDLEVLDDFDVASPTAISIQGIADYLLDIEEGIRKTKFSSGINYLIFTMGSKEHVASVIAVHDGPDQVLCVIMQDSRDCQDYSLKKKRQLNENISYKHPFPFIYANHPLNTSKLESACAVYCAQFNRAFVEAVTYDRGRELNSLFKNYGRGSRQKNREIVRVLTTKVMERLPQYYQPFSDDSGKLLYKVKSGEARMYFNNSFRRKVAKALVNVEIQQSRDWVSGL